MDKDSAKEVYAAMAPNEQVRFLARFGHNLTIAARDTYVVGSLGVQSPERLRTINERLHRLFSHIEALLVTGKARLPDDVFVDSMLDHPDEPLRSQVMSAFENSLRTDSKRGTS